MTTDITETLRLHKLWLESAEDGVRANLRWANLRWAKLIEAKMNETKIQQDKMKQ